MQTVRYQRFSTKMDLISHDRGSSSCPFLAAARIRYAQLGIEAARHPSPENDAAHAAARDELHRLEVEAGIRDE